MPNRYAKGNAMVRGTLTQTKPSGPETSSTTHASIDTNEQATVLVTIAVTAASGTTPTLVLVVEGSSDGVTWVTLGTIGANGYSPGTATSAPTNLTGAATVTGIFTAPQNVRTRSVIGGTTPSFTYSVAIEAS